MLGVMMEKNERRKKSQGRKRFKHKRRKGKEGLGEQSVWSVPGFLATQEEMTLEVGVRAGLLWVIMA